VGSREVRDSGRRTYRVASSRVRPQRYVVD
jgi:hypothetical protein